MNYDYSKIQDKYNDAMHDERDVIASFLKEQYDVRYGKQRDTWHFEPAVEVVARNGSLVQIHDIKLDKGRFVVFYVDAFLDKNVEWECFDFAYGELLKVIEALPDAEQLAIKNAVSDIANLCRECCVNIEEHPFNTKINGKFASIALVDCIDGKIVAYNHDGKIVSDEYDTDFLVGLRDHINIETLHRSDEYKKLMELLALQKNLGFECSEYGHATFVPQGSDMIFDVSYVHRDDNGNLVIYGFDFDDEECSSITLTEKDIKPQYLTSIIECVEKNMYGDIINTYNGHNPELVRKINTAWKSVKYHNKFSEILVALSQRDHVEFEDTFDVVVDADGTWAMNHAHEIMEGVCDDWDLETILSFIRYEE